VPRRNVFDLELVFERGHYSCNHVIGRDDKMETARDQMNFRVDDCRSLDDPFASNASSIPAFTRRVTTMSIIVPSSI
jgi:hypothetical protein